MTPTDKRALLIAYREYLNGGRTSYSHEIKEIDTFLNSLPEEGDGWVSVSEELPGLGKPVLICVSGSVSEAWYLQPEGWCNAFCNGLQNVNHWHPMIPPPPFDKLKQGEK